MNYLKNKRVYLCGPIHEVSEDGIGWRDNLTPALRGLGLVVDDPCKKSTTGLGEVKDDKIALQKIITDRDWALLKKSFMPIVHKDLRSVDHADFLITVYDPTIHMLGTIHELVVAHWQRKPILIYCDPAKLDRLNPWILTFVKSDCFFTDWSVLLDHLNSIDEGNIDTETWTLGEGQ